MSEASRTRVLVLGAGFGGLTFCQALAGSSVDITLVDQQNHHLFQPLLYQVATAGLSAPEIAQPIRSIVRQQRNLTVLLGNVTGFEVKEHAGLQLAWEEPKPLQVGGLGGYSKRKEHEIAGHHTAYQHGGRADQSATEGVPVLGFGRFSNSAASLSDLMLSGG